MPRRSPSFSPSIDGPRRQRTGRGAGIAALVAVVLTAGACAPGLSATPPESAPTPAPLAKPTLTPSPTSVVARLDTFTTSTAPDASRARDVVMRVMASQGKDKVGYMSFPLPAGHPATVSGTLRIHTVQAGFAVHVRDAGSFSERTTHRTRPALGAEVGSLPRSETDTTHTVAIKDAKVTNGVVNLGITTSSPYELEITSADGALGRSQGGVAPTLSTGVTAAAPTPAPAAPAAPTTTAPPAPAPAQAPAPASGPTPAGWNLTFADEFNGTAVDPSKWKVYDERKGDAVESPKASTCPQADNVSVGGGKLVMRTEKANGSCAGGQAQSGAGLNTFNKFAQAEGRFEARVRWTQRGNYLWGGFWTSDRARNDGTWTKDNPSEIDTFEYIGKVAEPNISRYKPAIHYNYTCSGRCSSQTTPVQPHDVTQWHTYATEWEPTDPADPTTMQIRFLVDDRVVAVFDRAGTWQVRPDGTRVLVINGGWKNPKGPFPNPFNKDHPHELTLSAWVGAPGVDAATVARGYNPAGGHADLEVDYVRVYER